MKPIAILLMAYGTPQTLDEIEPYYTDIRRGHKPSPELLHELTERYKRVGGRTPWIAATISSTRRVAATSCTRNIRTPAAAVMAVAARVPSRRLNYAMPALFPDSPIPRCPHAWALVPLMQQPFRWQVQGCGRRQP